MRPAERTQGPPPTILRRDLRNLPGIPPCAILLSVKSWPDVRGEHNENDSDPSCFGGWPPACCWFPLFTPRATPHRRRHRRSRREELDSLTAPIALYPDALLSQILMASTYPLEVVSAARWVKANPDVKGDAALKKVENETWDVSVKSLAAFPSILDMMNEKLDWTQKLGDAFLAQQKDVLASVQRLRKLAKNNGNLESNQQQVVRSEAQSIVIEPAQPQTIYVPAYNPTVVYGTWPYPAYPPYYYPPSPYYYPGAALATGFAWGLGIAAGAALIGGANWGGGDVTINANRAANIDRNYNRSSSNSWQHNSQHRGNAGYRDSASQQKFGNKQAERSRDEFRGREGGDRGGDRGGRDGIGGDRGGAGGAWHRWRPWRRGGDRGGAGGRDSIGGDRGGAGDRGGIGGDRGGAGQAIGAVIRMDSRATASSVAESRESRQRL